MALAQTLRVRPWLICRAATRFTLVVIVTSSAAVSKNSQLFLGTAENARCILIWFSCKCTPWCDRSSVNDALGTQAALWQHVSGLFNETASEVPSRSAARWHCCRPDLHEPGEHHTNDVLARKVSELRVIAGVLGLALTAAEVLANVTVSRQMWCACAGVCSCGPATGC